LLAARKEIVEKYKLANIDNKTINAYIADSIAKKFEVSSWAAELALNDLDNFHRK